MDHPQPESPLQVSSAPPLWLLWSFISCLGLEENKCFAGGPKGTAPGYFLAEQYAGVGWGVRCQMSGLSHPLAHPLASFMRTEG